MDPLNNNLNSLNYQLQDLPGAPQPEEPDAGDYFVDLVTSIPQAGLRAAGGIVNYLEAGERTLLDYIYRDLSPEEKAAKIKYLEENQEFGFLSEGDDNIFSNAARYFDRFDVKAEQSITEDLEDGNYARAGARAVVAGVESWPSIMAAYMGVPAMIALGVSYAGNKFEEEFEKNPEASMANLFVNATGTGAIEAGFEMATRGVLKYAGFLGEAPAKALIKGGMVELGKRLTFGFVGEGLSEAATEVTNNIWDSMTIEGREMPTIAQMKYQLGDAFIVGGLVGGTISGFGEINSRSKAAGDRATITLMPLDEKQKFNEGVKELRNLYADRRRAKTDEAKEIIDQEISKQTGILENIKNNTKTLLENLSSKDIKTYSKNVIEINKLLAQAKENSNNKTIQRVNSEKIKALNATNVNLLEASKVDLAETQFKNIQDIALELEKAGGKKINVLKGNTKDFEKFSAERGVTEEFDYSRRYGGMLPIEDANGNVTSLDIFINEEAVLRDGKVNTSAHEFLHAAVFATLKQDIEAGEVLGDAVLRALTANKATLREGSDFNDRINSYSKEEGAGEEILTLTAEAISNNEINLNEGFIGGLKDAFRRFGQRYLNFDMDLNKDQDVLNFVKDYARAIKDPSKLNKALIRVAAQGAKGRLAPKQVTPDQKLAVSKEASDNVQRLYENRADNASFEFDIIEQFKPIVGKIVDKRKDAPNFDRQLLTDEIETGQRGILDLIREYKQESGVPLAAFINKFLPARAIEASRRVLGEEFTEDVTEARGVIAEETADTEVETTREQKETVVADRLGVSEQAAKTIEKVAPDLDFENLNYKTLKNQLPDIVGELFGIKPEKLTTLANLTKKEIQTAQMFINKNADLLIALLPEGATASGTATGVPNTLLKAFYTKTDRAKAATTGSKAGLAIQQKNDIDREIFLETFGIINGKPDRTDRNISARILAIANVTGQVITNQTVRQNQKALGITQKAIDRIKEGKSKVMFSKAARQNTLEVLKIKIPSNLNSKDKKAFLNWIINEYAAYLPIIPRGSGYMLHAETFGLIGTGDNADIIRPGFFISKNEVTITATKAGMKQKKSKPFTKEEIKQIKEVYRSKLKDFNNLGKNLELLKSGVNYFVKGLNKTVNGANGNNQNLKWIEVLLRPSAFATTHVMRMMGGALGKTNVGKVKEKEHVFVQNAAGDVVFNAIAYDYVDLIMPWFVENYYMIGLNESQNALLKEYGSKMPEIFNENLQKAIEAGDMSLASDPLIRYTMSNQNLSEIDWHDGGTALSYADKKYGFDGALSYGDNSETSVKLVNDALTEFFAKRTTKKQTKKAIKNIASMKFSKTINSSKKLNDAIKMSRKIKDPKGITILDFDDTLATTKSLVKFTAPDGAIGTLNAEQYASTYQDLLDQGYTFDFSDFNKVVKGKIAPLFQKALKLQSKFGPENMFVLTARPPQAAKAIFDFLKANGLNIPLKNITGLANSTPEAKALWIAEKVGEGYNDFYFADDALQNVQAVDNMLNQFDVKRKVQQARVQFSKPANLDKAFNDILENITGIESKKRFAATKARKRGANKGKFRFFIPPSHEDFVGLLYNFMGKGRIGDGHRDFFEKALVRPLLRAHREIDTAKQAVANDYKALNKQMPNVRKMLTKKTPDGDFTYQDAIRVYIWDKHGYTIPGLSEVDQKDLVDLVRKDPSLQAYAETINTISKQDAYVDPGPNWETGNIRIDLVDATGRVGRKTYFAEFQENADIIFSEENLNKIEAGYGKDLREALEDMLHRIKTGINRPKGASAKPNMFMNWLNASVSGVMFFNTRSSILQQMSNVNYLNFADNNILAAGKAFANQPQYWKDFAMIFNSDMLKQRRGGLQTDINGAELAEAIKKARPGNLFDQVAIIIGKALKLGFLPTQIGDNIAIATGGAAFYRNRVNKYIKDGLPIDKAEKKAFNDFQEITQSTQQSAKPYMTSAQQAMWIGKLVLNFLNTPSQYNRIIKKAGSDIINRRITPPNTTQMQSDMSNMSRILYYGAAQNLIFYSLQTALFAVMFGLDDGDEDKKAAEFLKKKERVINGSIDTILRGSGIYGVAVSTLKNMAIKFLEQRAKGYNKDEAAVVMELLNFSPVVGIKARRIVNAEKTLNYNMKVIKEMETFDIDNPMWSAVTNYTQTITTAPTNKIYQKVINLRNAADRDYTLLQRILFFSGYTTWSLNLGDTKKMKEIKEKVKGKSQNKSKSKLESLESLPSSSKSSSRIDYLPPIKKSKKSKSKLERL